MWESTSRHSAWLSRHSAYCFSLRSKVKYTYMPELSRFYGIIIRMFAEFNAPHHIPHFHAYYQEEFAVFRIDPIELISGALPKRQQRFVEAWAELHQAELSADWRRLQAGQRPLPIEPLK